MMVSTIFSKSQLIDLYPQLSEPADDGTDKQLIDLVETDFDGEDYPDPSNSRSVESFTPDVVKDKDAFEVEKYRLIEHYSKIKVPYYRVMDLSTQQQQVLTKEQFELFMQQQEVIAARERGDLDFAEVLQTRIKLTCTIGQIVLYEQILDTDMYPIIPVPNIWTNTPYPMSDVRKNKPFQRFLNKVVSLITSHAQASSGLKLLIPQGSVQDIEELERDWANPNATIE